MRRSKCFHLVSQILVDHVLSIALTYLLHVTFPCVHPGWSPATFQPSQEKYTNEYILKMYVKLLPPQSLKSDLNKFTQGVHYWQTMYELISIHTNIRENLQHRLNP